MGQMLLPDNNPGLTFASTTSVTLAATNNGQATRLTIGGQQYRLSSALTLNTGTSGFGGMDTGAIAANSTYFVYAVIGGGGTVGLVASLSSISTGPSGYTGYAYVGKFKTSSVSTSITTVNSNLVIGSDGYQGLHDVNGGLWITNLAAVASNPIIRFTLGSESRSHWIGNSIATGRDLQYNSNRSHHFVVGANTTDFANEGEFTIFQDSSAGAQLFHMTHTGGFTFGPPITSISASGPANTMHGSLNAGGTGTGDDQRGIIINANGYHASYANNFRTRQTGIGGSWIQIHARSDNAFDAISFWGSQVADGATTNSQLNGYITQSGIWQIGPSTGNVTHVINRKLKFQPTGQNNGTPQTLNALNADGTYYQLEGTTYTLNGIVGSAPTDIGRVLWILARDGNVTVNHNSGSASAGNRILTRSGAAVTLGTGTVGMLVYTEFGGGYWSLVSPTS